MKNSILVVLVSIFMFYSCSEDSYSDDNTAVIEPNPTTPVSGDGITLKLEENATFGSIITDADGMSLYFFSKDTDGTSACNGGCASAWPVFYTQEVKTVAGLEEADFDVITREDGTKQNTYKGWPLYYYVGDTAAGDTTGDGQGNNWYIAKPDYSIMYAQAQLVGKDTAGNLINLKSDYTEGIGDTFYLTSGKGRTIYIFSNDTKNTNTFTDSEFAKNGAWPIIEFDVKKVPSIMDINDFGVIDVFGRTQVTYKGYPLYYFGGDVNRGDNFGVNAGGAGLWPIINTDTPPAPEKL